MPDNSEYGDFHGWFIVDLNLELSKTATIAHSDGAFTTANPPTAEQLTHFVYSWPDNPEQVTADTVIHTGTEDENVYLAPLFYNFRFVEFMEPSENGGEPEIATRKIVAMSANHTATVELSDVTADSLVEGEVFYGWKYGGTVYQTRLSTGDTIEQFLTLTNNDFPEGKSIVRIEPIFKHTDVIEFDTEASDATPVNAMLSFLYDPNVAEQERATITQLPSSTRTGYIFDGWYARYVDANGELKEVQVGMAKQNPADTSNVAVVTTAGERIRLDTDQNGSYLFLGKLYLRHQMTLYAHWREVNTADYKVVIWKQKVNDSKVAADSEKTYDYHAYTLMENAATESVILDLPDYINMGFENLAEGDSSFDCFHYSRTEVVVNGVAHDCRIESEKNLGVVAPDSSTVVNVYYDRDVMAIYFYFRSTDTPYPDGAVTNNVYLYTATTDSSGTQYGFVDGEYVQLTSVTVPTAITSTFKYKYTVSTSLGTNTYYYLDTNGEYKAVYYSSRDKKWYRTRTSSWGIYSYSDPIDITTHYARSNDTTAYNDTRYKLVNGEFVETEDTTGSLYGLRGDGYVELNVTVKNETVWYAKGVPYTGKRFTRSSDSTYKAMLTWTGLYGQTLAQNNYDWSTVNTIRWNDGKNVQTLLAGFSSKDNPYIMKSSGTLGTQVINHYKMTLDGSYSQSAVVSTHAPDNSSSFMFSNKFTGFTVDSYTNGNNSFSETGGSASNHVSPEESKSINSFPLNVYHKRNTYRLTLANYRTTNNSGDLPNDWEVPMDIYFEQPLSQVKAAHPEIMTPPARANYDFGGWYVDASCTKPVDFDNTTMPAENMILYAKWDLKHYIVEIDPDGGEMQAASIFDSYTNVTGSGTEITYTRVQYGESVLQPQHLQRHYVPAHNGEYIYVNVRLAPTIAEAASNWDKRVPEAYRAAFYCKRTELETVYNTYFAPLQSNGQQLLPYEDFLAYCVNNTQFYRKLETDSVNESYELVGWHKVNDDGTTSSEQYVFSDAVTKHTRIRAVWKRAGMFYLKYDPYDSRYQIGRDVMMDDHLMHNRTLFDPSDPDDQSGTESSHYHDQAQAVVLQHPTYIPAHYIFRGWQLLTDDGEDTGEYYAPGDTFIVDHIYADIHGIIHFEAAYEPESESVRIVDVVGLILDANTARGGYAVKGDLDIYESEVYADLDHHQVKFKNQPNNFKVKLKDYYDNFRNANGYMLLGWTDEPYDPATYDYIPKYPADAVIGIDKDSVDAEHPNILYAVWEPMVYLTLENHSASYDVTFTLHFDNFNDTVYSGYSNSVISDFVREKFEDHNDALVQVTKDTTNTNTFTVTIKRAAPETTPTAIKLVLPQGQNARYTVSGSIDNAKTDGGTALSSNHNEVFSVYNSGGASQQLKCRQSGNTYKWYDLDNRNTSNYHVSGGMKIGAEGQVVAFYTGTVEKVSVYIQGFYYDTTTNEWVLATAETGPKPTLSFEDYGNLSRESIDVHNCITGLDIIKNTDTNTFSINQSFADTAGYKFIGWYETRAAAPGDLTLDGKAGVGDSKVSNIPVPNTSPKYYFALYVPKADGDLVISHDEKATSIGYPKYMNVTAQYGSNEAVSDDELTHITSIADRGDKKVHTEISIRLTEADDPNTVLTITLGTRSGYGSVHRNTFEGTHQLTQAAEQVADDIAPPWYIYANPVTGKDGGYLNPVAGEDDYETKHLWTRTVTKTAEELFEDSETVKGLKVLNPLQYYSDFERKYEFVYSYVFRDGITPRKYLVTGSTAEHSTLDDFKHFVLENAPYVTNYGEDLSWNTATINVTNLTGKGKVYATMEAAQYKNAKANVFVHDAFTDVTVTWPIDVGRAFPEDNRPTAQKIIEHAGQTLQFKRWKITEAMMGDQGEEKLVGYCYFNEFTFMVWDDYDITPEYVEMVGDEYHQYYPDDENTAYVNIDFLKNTRNQWVDLEDDNTIKYDQDGNATYNDVLISDYSIIFIDHGLRINTNPDDYKIGLLYEVVGEVDENGEFTASSYSETDDNYRERVINAILKQNKDNGTVKLSNGRAKFYYSKINPTTLTHDNRIEFYRGIDNLCRSEELNPNAKYIFKVSAYMKLNDGTIVQSEGVTHQLFDLATRTNITG